ncbi:hypothetical protein [Streptomyces decoyicus]|uniref:hypothetical protein n=1 Tax=Streptomyces decoyicus TaxID=249567 RepID=UPI001FD77C6E|nr:hypothetical protein [Streptomyces decoyicus]
MSTTTGVTFGGVPATFAVLSDTRVAAVAPTHAPGAVTIALTTTGGGATARACSSTSSADRAGRADGPALVHVPRRSP